MFQHNKMQSESKIDLTTSVVDPFHFDADPDPPFVKLIRIRPNNTDPQDVSSFYLSYFEMSAMYFTGYLDNNMQNVVSK